MDQEDAAMMYFVAVKLQEDQDYSGLEGAIKALGSVMTAPLGRWAARMANMTAALAR